MGCGCGKGGGTSGARVNGTVPSAPMIFGDDDNNLPVRRVVLVHGQNGIPAGATRYARGTEVESLIASGALRRTDGG